MGEGGGTNTDLGGCWYCAEIESVEEELSGGEDDFRAGQWNQKKCWHCMHFQGFQNGAD